MSDLHGGDSPERLDLSANLQKRLGFKLIRWDLNRRYVSTNPQGEWATDKVAVTMRKHDLLGIGLLGGMDPARKKGQEVKGPRGREDHSPLLSELDGWEKYVEAVTRRYSGLNVGIIVWNEPWEGGGISYYGATAAHYREMLRRASLGARRGDPDCKVGANDSSWNLMDSLLHEPGAMDWVDVGTVHGGSNTPGQNGGHLMATLGKEAWDTETWDYAEEAGAIQQQVVTFVLGIRTAKPYPIGDLDSRWSWCFGAGKKGRLDTLYPRPTLAAQAVLARMVDGKPKVQRLVPDSFPFVFEFSGKEGRAAVVLGRLKVGVPGTEGVGNPHDQQTMGGELVLKNVPSPVKAFDIWGNPLLSDAHGTLTLPVGIRAVYVTAPAEFEGMSELFANAERRGMRPLRLEVEDLTAPISSKPVLRVRVINESNRPVRGKISIKTPVQLQSSLLERDLETPLLVGETRVLGFPITGGNASSLNVYPIAVTAHTDQGEASVSTAITVNFIPRASPPMHGSWEDWEKLGAPVQYLFGRSREVDWSQAYFYPWEKVAGQDEKSFSARLMLYRDKDALYLAVKVVDPDERRVKSQDGAWFTVHDPPHDITYKDPISYPFNGDNVQISMDVGGDKSDSLAIFPQAGWQRRFGPVGGVDYSFTIYPTEGGDTEVWRSRAPGIPWRTMFPFSTRKDRDQGLIEGTGSTAERTPDGWWYRVRIPLEALDGLDLARIPHLNLAVKVNNNGPGNWLQTSDNKTTAKRDHFSFVPYWTQKWSIETPWGAEH